MVTGTGRHGTGTGEVESTLAALFPYGRYALSERVSVWGMTENLKALATRRLRLIAQRWTGNRLAGFAWGMAAATITQSMSALTFIVVSVLRAGLISTRGAFAIILGGNVGVTLLVLVVTFDIELVSLYVLGAASAVMISERTSRYRPVAASFFGGAMIVLGLVLLKELAAPLADQPWFGEMVEGTGGTLMLAFLVATLLTAIVQSSSAVCVIGIYTATNTESSASTRPSWSCMGAASDRV